RSTMLRWGTYDAATGTVRWLASEIPTSGFPFVNGNPVPANRDVPPSLFLKAKPAAWWRTPWGAPPWPPVGPDVVGGQDAGHVHKNPARLCYENTPKDDHGVLTFNAAACYAGSPGSLPSATRCSPTLATRRIASSFVVASLTTTRPPAQPASSARSV